MSVHLTEEEQAEIFRRWWAKNGIRIIIAVLLGILLYWSWTQWQANNKQQAAEASTIYGQMIDTYSASQDRDLSEQQVIDITGYAQALKADHGSSQYALYSALMLAKLSVEQASYEEAVAQLDWVLANGADKGLSRIVTLRKARVEMAQGDLEAALALLESAPAEEMTSIYAEARGDIYVQLGNLDGARSAYQEALSVVQGNPSNSQLLELKLNRVTPAVQEVADVMVDELSSSSAE